MSTSRRGFFSRLFGAAAAAVVPPSWYLRQGHPQPKPGTLLFTGGLGEQAGLSNWKPIDPKNLPAADECAYNPVVFSYGVEGISYTGVKLE